MWKLRFLRSVSAVLLGFLLFANFGFTVGVCGGFAKGGINGVKRWINHITYEGTGTLTEVSPGVVKLSMPVIKHIYLSFALDWLFVIFLTMICFLVVRYCTRKIRALGAKPNPAS